ncbi:MAG: arginine deiminase-related protein [Pseudomonadota bacterium]
MTEQNRYLMCRPSYFDVAYVINPWMQGNLNGTLLQRAADQWQSLHDLMCQRAKVELVEPRPGLPDMPFAANAGLLLEDTVILSRFLYPERQGEEAHFERWFYDQGLAVLKLPSTVPFEGAGDALFDRKRAVLWTGYGHRSSFHAMQYIARWLAMEVVPLKLADPRFYHLDTCFCPLENGYLMYYPGGFDQDSQNLIAARVPSSHRIIVAEEDALNFACNAVNIGDTVILHRASDALREQLLRVGFSTMENELGEFMKAGGSAKCLTLRLKEPRIA